MDDRHSRLGMVLLACLIAMEIDRILRLAVENYLGYSR